MWKWPTGVSCDHIWSTLRRRLCGSCRTAASVQASAYMPARASAPITRSSVAVRTFLSGSLMSPPCSAIRASARSGSAKGFMASAKSLMALASASAMPSVGTRRSASRDLTKSADTSPPSSGKSHFTVSDTARTSAFDAHCLMFDSWSILSVPSAPPEASRSSMRASVSDIAGSSASRSATSSLESKPFRIACIESSGTPRSRMNSWAARRPSVKRPPSAWNTRRRAVPMRFAVSPSIVCGPWSPASFSRALRPDSVATRSNAVTCISGAGGGFSAVCVEPPNSAARRRRSYASAEV